MAGKGDTPRPISNLEEYRNNWDIIFGKKETKAEKFRRESVELTLEDEERERILERWKPVLDADVSDNKKLETAIILESEQKSMTADTLIKNLLVTLILETNCKETRKEVVNAMTSILNERHNTDMPFTVICDKSNNPPMLVAQKKLAVTVKWDNGDEGFDDEWEVCPITVDDVEGYYITKK